MQKQVGNQQQGRRAREGSEHLPAMAAETSGTLLALVQVCELPAGAKAAGNGARLGDDNFERGPWRPKVASGVVMLTYSGTHCSPTGNLSPPRRVKTACQAFGCGQEEAGPDYLQSMRCFDN
jgi:hypothetical protein